MLKNITTLKYQSRVNQRNWNYDSSIDCIWFFDSKFVPKTHRFSDIRLVQWLWNTRYRSLKVIGTDTYRSATYDFLLTFLDKYRPISYRFGHKRLFQCKIANSPVYFAPTMTGSYLNWVSALGGQVKKYNHRATRSRQMFDDIFSRLDTI